MSCVTIHNSVVLYPLWHKTRNFEYEALFCSIKFELWMNYTIGGIAYALLFYAAVIFVAILEFQHLSKELALIKRKELNLELKLKNFMNHHEELWKFISQFNYKVNFMIIIIYGSLVSGTSFCCYMYLFIKMNEVLKYLILGLIVLSTFTCLVCCFLVSCLAFSMEITFQEIRQFSACNMPLESKLKILNFMKRFGKVALKISIMGYFYVNKRFPIRATDGGFGHLQPGDIACMPCGRGNSGSSEKRLGRHVQG
ncbi:uncharacterized protein LOC111639764 [Centruroides sculpturatus]|uniref:uncharacterized protein LOC111639764 n=1 Tax=Centruroides sculpturatus TaxID=218467 RepID=UPI000C6EFC7C|nr:uncharacterized protein LOC111639764 [Centruroides sculpturatus]